MSTRRSIFDATTSLLLYDSCCVIVVVGSGVGVGVIVVVGSVVV